MNILDSKKEARLAKAREWKAKNKERVSEYNKKRYYKDVEASRARVRDYYLENRTDRLEYNKQWKSENKEYVADYNKSYCREYYPKNKEKFRDYARKYYTYEKGLRNREKMAEYLKNYSKDYLAKNLPAFRARNAKRRASKLQATPKWLTDFDMQYIRHLYIQARELELLDGIPREVDHIVPLQSKLVCGLRVPWNLEILTERENASKGNRI